MVWNVLWLAAMAAASALAGFCMGRLSVSTEEAFEEEAEAALPWNVRVGRGSFKASVDKRLKKMEGDAKEAVGESVQVMPVESDSEGVAAEKIHLSGGSHGGGQVRAGAQSYGVNRGQGRQRMRVGTAVWLSGRGIWGNENGIRPMRRANGGKNQQMPEGESFSVGSPVSGWVTSCREGDHPAVIIQPVEDKLYAPVAGKITRLFPMGNAFLFSTEFGAEIRIQVCDVNDDLLGRYFRPRVVQNEIVGKGKLLLEFDSQGLVAEGASVMATVSVENRAYGSRVQITAKERVMPGEEILRVVERA